MKAIALLFLTFGLSIQLTAQDATINWLSFEELEEKYRVEPKPMLLFLHTDWCKYCRIQENTTFKDKEIIEIMNKEVYAVKFDAESKEDFVFFGREYSYSEEDGFHSLATYLGGEKKLSFPTTVILDKMMDPIYRRSSVINKEEMKRILP